MIHVVASTSGLSTEQMFIGIGVTTCEGKARSCSALGAVILTRNDRTAGFYGADRGRAGADGRHALAACHWSAATASTCSLLEAAYASAPSLPRVTTTHLSRSPETERTAWNIAAEVTSGYCVSDPITTVAGHVVAPGTGGDVTRRADSAAVAVPVGYLV